MTTEERSRDEPATPAAAAGPEGRPAGLGSEAGSTQDGFDGRPPERGGRRPLLWTLAAAALILGGVAARVYQYASDTVLWSDEAAVAYNLMIRSFTGFFGPLEMGQVAPIGYLFASKALAAGFGYHLQSFGLVSLLGGIAALVLFWFLAKELLPRRAALPVLGLVAFNYILIRYASEVKQYGLDVALAALVLLLGARILQRGATRRRLWTYAAAGAVVMWFSLVGVFVLASTTLALLLAWWRSREGVSWAGAAVASAWGVSALPAVWLAMRWPSEAGEAFMAEFWAEGFIPFPPLSPGQALAVRNAFNWVFFDFFPHDFPEIALFAFALGVYAVLARSAARSVLLLGPLVLTLVASGLDLYPFGGGDVLYRSRVVLFLLPTFALLVGEGIELVWSRARWGWLIAGAMILGGIAQPAVDTLESLPDSALDYRAVTCRLAREMEPGDMLVLEWGRNRTFTFHAAHCELQAEGDAAGSIDLRGLLPAIADETMLHRLDTPPAPADIVLWWGTDQAPPPPEIAAHYRQGGRVWLMHNDRESSADMDLERFLGEPPDRVVREGGAALRLYDPVDGADSGGAGTTPALGDSEARTGSRPG